MLYIRAWFSSTDIQQNRSPQEVANGFEILEETTCDATSKRTPCREDSADSVHSFGLVRDSKTSLANLRV